MTERFGASAVSLVGNIMLANVLLPEDFGLVAMLGIFTSMIFALVDCGMSDALLRESRPSQRDFNTLFYYNVAVGIGIFALFALAAPWVALWYGRTELQPVMTWLGLGAIFTALTIAQSTRLRSQLRFRQLAFINIAAIVIALAIALVMALGGCRYWALVELQVGFSAAYWVLLVVTSRWHLRWEFDRARFGQLWRFGANLLLGATIVQLSQNVVAAILGSLYNATQAGYMGQAQKLQQTPVNTLELSVSNTTYVLMAKHTSTTEQDWVFTRVYSQLTRVLLAGCLMGIALAPALIQTIFPARWLPVVPYLRLLLVWAMVYPLGGFMATLLKLRNRTDIVRNIVVAERLAIVVAAIGLGHYGVAAMIMSFVAISAIAVLCHMWQCARLSSFGISSLLLAYARSLAIAAAAALPVWLLSFWLEAAWAVLLAGLALSLPMLLLLVRRNWLKA